MATKTKTKLNFNHLYYFWIIAKEGGFTRATKVLEISQPSLSSQMRELESDLGYDIFKLVGRCNVLTEKGAELYGICNDMFYSAELIKREIAP